MAPKAAIINLLDKQEVQLQRHLCRPLGSFCNINLKDIVAIRKQSDQDIPTIKYPGLHKTYRA